MLLKDTKLTISRVNSNTEDPYIRILLEDNLSALQIVDVKISMENFALALTGLGFQDCETEYNNNPNINKKKENKTESVHFSCYSIYYLTEEQFNSCVEQFEVDGWQASYSHFKNSRKIANNDGYYNVPFERWV